MYQVGWAIQQQKTNGQILELMASLLMLKSSQNRIATVQSAHLFAVFESFLIILQGWKKVSAHILNQFNVIIRSLKKTNSLKSTQGSLQFLASSNSHSYIYDLFNTTWVTENQSKKIL